ncbi:hypothetical protein FRB98_006438, partial [Tulasnella sp. 332]
MSNDVYIKLLTTSKFSGCKYVVLLARAGEQANSSILYFDHSSASFMQNLMVAISDKESVFLKVTEKRIDLRMDGAHLAAGPQLLIQARTVTDEKGESE